MRNQTAKFALEAECDYLLFVDDDVVIPTNALDRLLACEADIAAGHTIIRGYPFLNMHFRHPDGDKNSLENVPHSAHTELAPGEILPVDAVGFSCALIDMKLLRKVPAPWFVTGPNNTEDIYFCMKSRHLFPETKIVVDTGVKTCHALGTEYIDPDNRELYKKYCEEAWPLCYVPKEEQDRREKIKFGDRGPEYLAMVKGGAPEAFAYVNGYAQPETEAAK